MIRLAKPSIDKSDFEAVCSVLESGNLVQGPKVDSFEKVLEKCVNTDYAIAVSSCTAALHLSLLSLNVGPGDLVLVTSYTWIATANVIELCGAKPIFVDIRPDTFNIDPDRLEAQLKSIMAIADTASRLKIIMPVHTFGQMADMEDILALAELYGLSVVEDAACALGAEIKGRQAGNWGSIGCLSFHPRKAITTGEGGVVTTNDAKIARKIRILRNHGQDPDSEKTDFILPGFNYRMTDFQAALGIKQLSKLKRIITARQRLASNYNKLLYKTPIKSPVVLPTTQHVYQSYVALLPEELADQRDTLIKHMKNRGIETTIGTCHIPMTSYYRNKYGYKSGDFPVTDKIFARSISLPLHEKLLEQEQVKVIETLTDLMKA